MMKKSIIQSERQRPHAIELMKDIYASHVADPKCGMGVNCPMMLSLKKQIEEAEQVLGRDFSRPFGLK